MRTALTIAGSDPTGGAGLQADLKVFKAFGVHGLSVPAALTAQSTAGVNAIMPVGPDFLERQLDTLLRDIRPDALKTGMLFTATAVEAVGRKVRELSLRNLVIDPVSVSSSGMSLVEDGVLDSMREVLFPLCRVVTPNIYEASLFTGTMAEDEAGMREAAQELRSLGPDVVVVTGGHLEEATIDVVYDGKDFHSLESSKVPGEYHGTGCVFSAAITASLALGHSPLEAIRHAKEFVTEAIRKAFHPGHGMGILRL